MVGLLIFSGGLFVLMAGCLYEAIRDAEMWREKAVCNAQLCTNYWEQREALSNLIARHRVDLDDESLWNGYTEWKKTAE